MSSTTFWPRHLLLLLLVLSCGTRSAEQGSDDEGVSSRSQAVSLQPKIEDFVLLARDSAVIGEQPPHGGHVVEGGDVGVISDHGAAPLLTPDVELFVGNNT